MGKMEMIAEKARRSGYDRVCVRTIPGKLRLDGEEAEALRNEMGSRFDRNDAARNRSVLAARGSSS